MKETVSHIVRYFLFQSAEREESEHQIVVIAYVCVIIGTYCITNIWPKHT